ETPKVASGPALLSGPAQNATDSDPGQRLEALLQNVKTLQKEQKEAQTAPLTEQQKKQLDLLQKQIKTQQKMIELLVEQMKKQAPATTPLDKLQTQTATLEARSQRAAQRDQELAGQVDDLREHVDAQERNSSWLPATLKQLFDPMENNETPLSIYARYPLATARSWVTRPAPLTAPDVLPRPAVSTSA